MRTPLSRWLWGIHAPCTSCSLNSSYCRSSHESLLGLCFGNFCSINRTRPPDRLDPRKLLAPMLWPRSFLEPTKRFSPRRVDSLAELRGQTGCAGTVPGTIQPMRATRWRHSLNFWQLALARYPVQLSYGHQHLISDLQPMWLLEFFFLFRVFETTAYHADDEYELLRMRRASSNPNQASPLAACTPVSFETCLPGPWCTYPVVRAQKTTAEDFQLPAHSLNSSWPLFPTNFRFEETTWLPWISCSRPTDEHPWDTPSRAAPRTTNDGST